MRNSSAKHVTCGYQVRCAILRGAWVSLVKWQPWVQTMQGERPQGSQNALPDADCSRKLHLTGCAALPTGGHITDAQPGQARPSARPK